MERARRRPGAHRWRRRGHHHPAPLGGLIDRARHKRTLIAAAVLILAAGALAIALFPARGLVMTAQASIGGVSSLFNPAIAAISLGIVGHRAFDRRQGRNQGFNSAGNVAAAAACGALGYWISNRSVFFFVVLLSIPTFATLLLIRPEEIDHDLARNLKDGDDSGTPESYWALLRDRPLVTFLVCAVMFHFANAAMLPLLGEKLAKARGPARWPSWPRA